MDARPRRPRFALVALVALGTRITRAAWLVGSAIALLATALVALAPHDARAEPATGDALDPALAAQIRDLAAAPVAANAANTPRIEVVVGTLDPRLHLAPCERIEPYLPGNARPWGKTRVGLRCVRGPSPWNVYLPVTVHAWSRGLMATSAVAVGAVVQTRDVAEGEVDLAESNSPALVDAAKVVGRTLAQPLKPGQSVRAAHLRARQWFAAGDTVRLVATGSGFRLEGEGQALSNGVEGQAARVRTENGHVVTGAPVGERLVELTL